MLEIKAGDRVRIVHPQSAYTGCRGSVVETSGPTEDGQLPLGFLVAIDGENGLSRAFLAGDLQRIKAIAARRSTAADEASESAWEGR